MLDPSLRGVFDRSPVREEDVVELVEYCEFCRSRRSDLAGRLGEPVTELELGVDGRDGGRLTASGFVDEEPEGNGALGIPFGMGGDFARAGLVGNGGALDISYNTNELVACNDLKPE